MSLIEPQPVPELPEAFHPGEDRSLEISAEVIDAAYVVNVGTGLKPVPPDVHARLVEIPGAPGPERRGPRRYLLTGLPLAVAALGRLRVHLWNGAPAGDQRRLARIAEAALSPLPSTLSPERSE